MKENLHLFSLVVKLGTGEISPKAHKVKLTPFQIETGVENMITSTANGKVKRLVNLQKKRKLRDEENIFLVEGLRMFMEVPSRRVKELYVSETFYAKEKGRIQKVLADRRVAFEVLSDHVYAFMSDTKTPQGVLCVVKREEYTLQEMLCPPQEQPFLLVLDNLQDPGNLGTMMRAAEGAGVTGVILSRDCVDIYNPKTIRSTMGSIFRMPFYYAEDIVKETGRLHKAGIRIYAAHLEGDISYEEAEYTGPTAFLIGNEGNGLRDEAAACADTYVRIPMKGQVESLNAAVAASILIFEAARQRRLCSSTFR